jgi:hypothetical protein
VVQNKTRKVVALIIEKSSTKLFFFLNKNKRKRSYGKNNIYA